MFGAGRGCNTRADESHATPPTGTKQTDRGLGPPPQWKVPGRQSLPGLSTTGVGSLYPRRRGLAGWRVSDARLGMIVDAPRPVRRPVECGDLPFLIQRDGTWLYRGSPIGRKELVCLFSSVLKRDGAGEYWLETPAERGRIQVEDTPWVAVELDWCGCGRDQRLVFRTNVDQIVTASAEHPIRVACRNCEPVPYVTVKPGIDGAKPIEARIARSVYYELVAIAVPGAVGCSKKLGVWSCGTFFPLGDCPDGQS